MAAELTACRSCGLLRDHFESFASEAADEADPILETLWEACEADWESVEAHEKFTARASQTGAYAQAARAYRSVLKSRPADPKAQKQLERVTKMAEVALLSSRPVQVEDEGPKAYRGLIVMLVFLVVIGAILGIYTMTKKGDSKPKKPKKPAVSLHLAP